MVKKISEKTILLEIAKITGLIIWVLSSTLNFIGSQKNIPMDLLFEVRLLQALSGYIVISLFYWILDLLDRRFILTKRGFLYLSLPVCLIISILWNAVAIMFGYFCKVFTYDPSNIHLLRTSLFYLIPTLALTGLYYAIIYWLNFKHQKEKVLTATSLANEAQLQMLRYQINPHFLFNALNTIRSMVEEDKEVARKMITELANFFRYSLSHNGTIDTLENEVNAIKNYLEIQKIRFEEKLIVEYNIDERLYSMKIPFFIILPLVENAIKFGLQTSKIPLYVRISAKINHHLEIRICNTGSLVKNTENRDCTKTGIENTKKRLELYFPDNHSFKLFEEDDWVVSQIIINDFRNHLPT